MQGEGVGMVRVRVWRGCIHDRPFNACKHLVGRVRVRVRFMVKVRSGLGLGLGVGFG